MKAATTCLYWNGKNCIIDENLTEELATRLRTLILQNQCLEYPIRNANSLCTSQYCFIPFTFVSLLVEYRKLQENQKLTVRTPKSSLTEPKNRGFFFLKNHRRFLCVFFFTMNMFLNSFFFCVLNFLLKLKYVKSVTWLNLKLTSDFIRKTNI